MDKHGSILWIKTYAAGLGKVFSFVVPLILGGVVNLGLYYWLKPGMWLAILIFLLSTMPVIYIYLKISQAFNEYSFIESKLVEVLNKDIDVFSQDLTKKPARAFPNLPTVSLKNYIHALASIKNRGYFEFDNCQNMGLNTKKLKTVYLHIETPGMHQYFMVLRRSEGDVDNGYIKINPPEKSYVDGRDFTHTWFNRILPIIGENSESVSEKMAGNPVRDEAGEYFIIRNFKICKRGKVFRVYL